MGRPEIIKKFVVCYSVYRKNEEIDSIMSVRREEDRYFAKRWIYPAQDEEAIGDEKGYFAFEPADKIAREEAEKRLQQLVK